MKVDLDKASRIWKNPPICIVCQNDNWHSIDRIFELTEYCPNGSRSNDVVIPIVVLACKDCGYVALFNATLLGLVEKNKEA